MIQQMELRYSDGIDTMVGQLVWDDALRDPAPGVLVAPAFGGLSPFEVATAEALAGLGYVALAVDYYGDGKRARNGDEASAWMAVLNADRSILIRRMQAALVALKDQTQVDATRTGALGYCLGGKAVLDLARSGAAFQACVPVHGVFDAPEGVLGPIVPSVLALHGWDDPLATPQDVEALAAELTKNCADWQIQAFGHTGHAFTNPMAQDKAGGMMYSERATKRSWAALTSFLAECLTPE
ncbi:dienelactone hydrolase family protein [Aestuariicoccus sp. MJ-SS9]|uniref:dienelactone hydrolase family protein n=1 Tax=Aestuariicoccus sp. MJ-SS9 TaxID=3079855 RepID=UPI00290FB6CC|nr:dienelactone hydrolase family protein [Aestuariicoccus sp. MJ-SS9]MDU8911190.1 dienelactone hydrolase family protein [Aestuariicoccus sp. MJ-SS9]